MARGVGGGGDIIVESRMGTRDWLLVASPPDDDDSWDVVEVRSVVGVLLGEAEVDVAREGKGVSLCFNPIWGGHFVSGGDDSQSFTYQMKSNPM